MHSFPVIVSKIDDGSFSVTAPQFPKLSVSRASFKEAVELADAELHRLVDSGVVAGSFSAADLAVGGDSSVVFFSV
ncbi:hypothetical protein [Companilactobacillus zhongbaensis]|uniref:hypothetical protein n=1 Tax=Companilactobacillus zhongbaensis TaxID=2486009 RepID=UPI000F77ED71|nr:hypothetical protein [Companilactobacillus zhongbaensis]